MDASRLRRSTKSQTRDWFRPRESGLQLFVRLTPGSSVDAVGGVFEAGDGHRYVKARVRAAPENGKANRALEKLIAKKLRLAKSDVNVTGGATSRFKTVSIAGDQTEISRRFAYIEAKTLEGEN